MANETAFNLIRKSVLGLAAICSVMMALPVVASAKERFALIIANTDYRHTADVAFAQRDADAIESALVDVMGVKRGNVFRYENTSMADMKFLFGEEGRPGQIYKLVTGTDSELFVYFAGHGSKEIDSKSNESKPYLLAVDSRPESLNGTAFSLDVLVSQLSRLQSEALQNGRITLVLESCFSGRSDAGDLIEGRSAPAFGAPVTISRHVPKTNENFVILAAAQGNQFAVWDTEFKRSVFTDALVSGIYGEADDARFSGDADGKVSLTELKAFVSRRISRRLRTVRPGERQVPDFSGGADDTIVAETGDKAMQWSEITRRSHGEMLKSRVILAGGDVKEIEGFLESCLYCPNADELGAFVAETKRQAAICDIERATIQQLTESGTAAEIISFKEVSECREGAAALDNRLARLGGGEAKPVASVRVQAKRKERRLALNTAPATARENATQGERTGIAASETVEEIETELDEDLLTRQLQSELKRVGCLAGRVDGIWLGQSRGAMDQFNNATDQELEAFEPTVEALNAVQAVTEAVCAPAGGGNSERATNGSDDQDAKPIRKKANRLKSLRNKSKSTTATTTTRKATTRKATTRKASTAKRTTTKRKTTTARKTTNTKKKTAYKAPKKTQKKTSNYNPASVSGIRRKSNGSLHINSQCQKYGHFC